MKRSDVSSKNKLLSPAASPNNPKVFQSKGVRSPTHIETGAGVGNAPSNSQLSGTPSSKSQQLITPKAQRTASPKPGVLSSKLAKGNTPQSPQNRGYFRAAELSTSSQEKSGRFSIPWFSSSNSLVFALSSDFLST